MIHPKILVTTALLLASSLCIVSNGFAKVSAQEAERLKKDLTPFGAVRAGNEDGTIPAWEGGLSAIPEGITYKKGDRYQDPFADDKVLFTITAQNMEQYADKLSEGQKGLLKKYPDSYRMDIYQTRRTHAQPDWVSENTFKNATSAELAENGLGFSGAYAGIPFPIPTRGEEAMINANCRWRGAATDGNYLEALVDGAGRINEGGGGYFRQTIPFYYNRTDIMSPDINIWGLFVEYKNPARRKGEFLLAFDAANNADNARKAWQYLPGQRRVRRAPNLAYDTPITGSGGLANYDETYMFNGNMDRYDWKLVGRKEIYIPYNAFQLDLFPLKELLTPKYLNAEAMRWELHRVWVVEATVKKGKRHAYARRLFYLDEDSWVAVGSDSYDKHGELWRTALATSHPAYNLPGVVQRVMTYYDLQTESYYAIQLYNEVEGPISSPSQERLFTDGDFTPEYLRKVGRR